MISCCAHPFAVLLNPPIPTEPFGPTGHKSSSLSSSLSSSKSNPDPIPAPPFSSSSSLSELSATSLLLPNLVGSLGCLGRRWTGLGLKATPGLLDVEATLEADRTEEADPLPLRRGIRRGALQGWEGRRVSGLGRVSGGVMLIWVEFLPGRSWRRREGRDVIIRGRVGLGSVCQAEACHVGSLKSRIDGGGEAEVVRREDTPLGASSSCSSPD